VEGWVELTLENCLCSEPVWVFGVKE